LHGCYEAIIECFARATSYAQVSDAIEKSNLELLDAHVVPPEMPLAEVLQLICERPVLVVDSMHADVLVGVLTSSDIL
jgi:hypothetical protein